MTVVWSAQAIHNLVALRNRIAQDARIATRRIEARRTADAVIAAVESVASTPAKGRPGRHPDTREAPVDNTGYVLSYTVRDQQLAVLAVLFDAHRLDKAL